MPELTKQQQFSQDLRNLADFYDQNPNLNTPEGKLYFSASFKPENLASLPDGENIFVENYDLFRRVISFGDIQIRFYCGKKALATQSVTGQTTVDVVEWVIKPEFLEPSDAV